MTEYYLAKQIKMPDNVPASAGGLNKSSNAPFPVSPLANSILAPSLPISTKY